MSVALFRVANSYYHMKEYGYYYAKEDCKNPLPNIDNTNEIQLINNYGANTLMEVVVHEVPKELDGIKMKDSHLTDRYSIQIIIIKRNNEYLFVDKDMIIEKDDIVTLFGPYVNIRHLFNNGDK